jgi:hypothetical protein
MVNGKYFMPHHRTLLILLDTSRFLAYVDLLGTTYSASTLATGYGSYIAQPLLRKAVEGRENELSEGEARKIIEDSMRVLFYRDARSIDKVSCRMSRKEIADHQPFFNSTKLRPSQVTELLFRDRYKSRRRGHLRRGYVDMVHRRNEFQLLRI